MAVEVRRMETAYAETPPGTADRVEVTYELGFATPSGGWVRMASVPESIVQAAEDNAKAAQQTDTGPADLSQPPAEAEAPAPADETGSGTASTTETEQPAAYPAAEPAPVDPAPPAQGEAG